MLSLFAVRRRQLSGPQMHRQTVEIARSLTDRQLSELSAIARGAPRPNIMLVALLGHFIAGAAGAPVATVALCGPSVSPPALALVVERFRKALVHCNSGRFGASGR